MSSKEHPNSPSLYRFSLGHFAERLRLKNGETQESVGKKLGMSQSGYDYLEKGKSTNLARWWMLFELYDLDVVFVLKHCRILVRALQLEEQKACRELTKAECETIAFDYYPTLPF